MSSVLDEPLAQPLTKLCRCPLFLIFSLKPGGSYLFSRSKNQKLLLSSLWHKIQQDSNLPFSTICHILRFYWNTALLKYIEKAPRRSDGLWCRSVSIRLATTTDQTGIYWHVCSAALKLSNSFDLNICTTLIGEWVIVETGPNWAENVI